MPSSETMEKFEAIKTKCTSKKKLADPIERNGVKLTYLCGFDRLSYVFCCCDDCYKMMDRVKK